MDCSGPNNDLIKENTLKKTVRHQFEKFSLSVYEEKLFKNSQEARKLINYITTLSQNSLLLHSNSLSALICYPLNLICTKIQVIYKN